MKHLKKFENYNPDIDSGVEEVTLDMAKKWVDREIDFFDECEDVYQAVDDMSHDIDTHFINDRKKLYNEEELIEYMKTKWNELFGTNLKKFNEEITNLSKKRKFPTYAETRGASDKNYKDSSDFYFLYHLPKEKRGDYLNTWFKGKNSMKDGVVLSDEMWTFKKTDKETSSRLYHKNYNPVAIKIYWPIGVKFQKDIDSYDMKAVIHSIDDSSFGVWWKGKPISELIEIRDRLMEWINYQPHGLNGEEFLKICVDMGADEETIDYD